MVATLTGQELSRQVAPAAGFPRWLPAVTSTEAVFSGRFACIDLPRGLSLHYTDGRELANLTSAVTLSERLSFAVILQGKVDFSLQGQQYHLEGQPQQPRCAALLNEEPLAMQRHMRAGARVRKVHVSVSGSWLRDHYPRLSQQLCHRGLEHGGPLPEWLASHRMTEAAETILAVEGNRELDQLRLESRALMILDEGLERLQQWYGFRGERLPRQQRLEPLLGYLDQYLQQPATQPLNLATLARQFGMSPSTLQRHFRDQTGTSVQDYCRTRRLHRSRELLLAGHLSIGEAAFQAGYRHSANFIAAYRQMFGRSPGQDIKASGAQPS